MADCGSNMLRRRSGFAWPLHPLQGASWTIGLAQVAVAYSVVYPALTDAEGNCFLALFSLLFALTALLTAKTTAIDPTDPVVYLQRESQEKGTPFDEHEFTLICTYCESNVSAHSKHCAQCNRCVADFDHHCKWLNNCIGGANYRWYAAMLGTLESLEVTLSVFGLIALIDTIDISPQVTNTVKLVVLVTTTAVAAVLTLVIMQLILFHVWLRARGMTTFDHIKERRAKKIKPVTIRPAVEVFSTISTASPQFKTHFRTYPVEEFNIAEEMREVSEEASYSSSSFSNSHERPQSGGLQ